MVVAETLGGFLMPLVVGWYYELAAPLLGGPQSLWHATYRYSFNRWQPYPSMGSMGEVAQWPNHTPISTHALRCMRHTIEVVYLLDLLQTKYFDGTTIAFWAFTSLPQYTRGRLT